jgi:hypothetical protein
MENTMAPRVSGGKKKKKNKRILARFILFEKAVPASNLLGTRRTVILKQVWSTSASEALIKCPCHI